MQDQPFQCEHIALVPFFVTHAVKGFLNGYAGIKGYSKIMCYYKNEEADWLTLHEDHKKAYLEILKKKPEEWEKEIALWKLKFQKFQRKLEKEKHQDWSKLTDMELLATYNQIHQRLSEEIGFPAIIDGFTYNADKDLYKEITEFCKKNNILYSNEIFEKLASPILPSFLNEVENDIADIKEKDQFIVPTSNYVKDHLSRYFWLKGNYVYSEEYSYEHFMKTALSLKDDYKIDFKKIRNDKLNLINQHRFNSKILLLSRMTELFIDWQDHRKIFTLTQVYFCQKLISEISKRTRIQESLLKFALFDEFEDILNNSFDMNILKKRRMGMMFIYQKGDWKILTGREAYELYLKATHKEYDNTNEIKGLTASLGKVTGTARIVLSLNDLKKVQQGDILIAPMTRPEHIIAMKRASAIVTDDGGITSHAAIVSRELGIPCVIGTNIATKVFKDGDLIEVDANSGMVRKQN